MFGRTSNQSNDGVNINTTFKTLFSSISSLSIGGWNTQLSIKITPVSGVDPNGQRQYDTKRRANTALTPEKAYTLVGGIDKVILPELLGKSENEVSVAVSMGTSDKKNVLAVEYKKDTDTGNMEVFLTLYQMIKEDNSTDPSNIYSYKFGNNTYVTNYNPKDGSYGKEDSVSSEFLIFYDMLKNISNMLPISAHGNKYANTLSAKYSKFNDNNQPNINNNNYDAPISNFGNGTLDDMIPFS
jgi:hypothetical protein|nr:MAG TPA: hypothetical protein [Caudoviricetes sp.]